MGLQTFSKSILSEVTTTRLALIVLLERRDKLLYIDAPALRNEYMLKIGGFEQQVLETELDTKMLVRKLELIQIARNQRKPIDMQQIDSQIETERKQLLSELNAKSPPTSELPKLSDEDAGELQKKYKDIVSSFHPSVNTNLTETQAALYEKANDAYRAQNLDMLRVIFDMLYDESSSEIMVGINLNFDLDDASGDITEEYATLAEELSTDYRLAQKIFSCFEQTDDDLTLLRINKRYISEREQHLTEIVKITSGFPFNAKSTLNDDNLINQYIDDLKLRLKLAEEKSAELNKEITALTGAIRYER
jgi:hypothetical protein